jgi:large subunit ribosomal protein L28
MWWEEGKKYIRLRVSTKGLKTIKKYGLNKAANKFGLNLHKFNA